MSQWDYKQGTNVIRLSGVWPTLKCPMCQKVSYVGGTELKLLFEWDAFRIGVRFDLQTPCYWCGNHVPWTFDFSEYEDRFFTRFWLNHLNKSFSDNIPGLPLEFLPGLERTNIFSVHRVGDNFQQFELAHLGQISSPSLVLSRHDLGQLGSQNADIVFDLLKGGRRIVEYRNNLVVSDRSQFKGVFGPAIDTLVLSEALFKCLLDPLQKRVKECIKQLGHGLRSKAALRHALFSSELARIYNQEFSGTTIFPSAPSPATCIDRGLFYIVPPLFIPKCFWQV